MKRQTLPERITAFAHSYGYHLGQSGMNNFDPWFFTDGGFDMVHSTENCGVRI